MSAGTYYQIATDATVHKKYRELKADAEMQETATEQKV